MYCEKCGKEYAEGTAFCAGCGAAVGNANEPMQNVGPDENERKLLGGLSAKVKTEGFVWIGVAAVQALMGLIMLLIGSIESALVLIVICVLNFIAASNDLKYAKVIFEKPTGIVKKYQPVTGLIISLVYNVIFGGVVGVAGIIFGFVTRSYVLGHQAEFTSLEARYPAEEQ